MSLPEAAFAVLMNNPCFHHPEFLNSDAEALITSNVYQISAQLGHQLTTYVSDSTINLSGLIVTTGTIIGGILFAEGKHCIYVSIPLSNTNRKAV